MYTELHCHSAFSFLDGASLPEQLALTASQLGYPALALTDHHGLYGSMAFAQEAKQLGLQAITGSSSLRSKPGTRDSSCCRDAATASYPACCGATGWPLPAASPSGAVRCSGRRTLSSSCRGTTSGETSPSRER